MSKREISLSKGYIPSPRRRVKGKRKRISHIVLEKVGYKIDSNDVVHHINEDTLDNRIENLRIMSRSNHAKLHNKRDYNRFGISAAENKREWSKMYRKYIADQKGIPSRIFKVTREIYFEIKKLLKQGKTQKYIACLYNLDPSTVSRVNVGKGFTRFEKEGD